jgi:hypothetical protein
MEVVVIAAVYLLLFVAGCVYFIRWDKEVENHTVVDASWKSADEEKKRQVQYWSDQFTEATKSNDTRMLTALCITELKVLGDEANSLTRLAMKIDNSLYHLRYRALELERLTKPLIIGAALLYFATVLLAVESTLHLIEHFQERSVPSLRVTFPVPPAPASVPR